MYMIHQIKHWLTLEDQNINNIKLTSTIQTDKNEKKASENNVNIKHKSYLIGFYVNNSQFLKH